MMPFETDICVIGAGLIGSALALSLVAKDLGQPGSGYKITLVDTQKLIPPLLPAAKAGFSESPVADPRVSAINAATQMHLASMGVWPSLLHKAHAYKSMSIWDGHNEAELHFHAAEVDAENLGYTIANYDLLSVLHASIAEKMDEGQIDFYQVKAIQAIEAAPVGSRTVRLIQGDETQVAIPAKLVIAADGKASPARQLLGITATSYGIEQTAITCLIECEKAHEDCAKQIFLANGPMALLPTRATNLCALIWTCTLDQAASLKKLEPEAFSKAVTSHFRHKVGTMQQIGSRYDYPVIQSLADCYIAPGFALAGDAAHSIHPLAGLGLNLGIADVSAITDSIVQYGIEPSQRNRLLTQYQALRQGSNEQYLQACRLLDHSFRAKLWYTSLARKTAMEWLNQSAAIKRQLIFAAMDPSCTAKTQLPSRLTNPLFRGLNKILHAMTTSHA